MPARPEERVCLEVRRHGVVLARPLAEAISLAAAGALLLVVSGSWVAAAVAAVAFAAAAAALARAVWRWERLRVVVTTEKLLVVEGTLRRRIASAVHARSGTLVVEQSLLGRLLGYGTVSAGELEIPFVPEPRRIYGLVEQLGR